MKLKLFAFMIALLSFAAQTNAAHAFSTEQSGGSNGTDAANLADPDDMAPVFMASPNGSMGSDISSSLSLTQPGALPPSMQNSDSGAQAFERAFAHQQDK